MPDDFIPPPDDSFDTWQKKFNEWCQSNGASHGLTSDQLAALGTLQTAWGYSWAGFQNVETAFHSATQDKTAKRTAYEAACRAAAVVINGNASTTNGNRVDAGLTPRSDTRTPAPVPDTSPTMQKIDTSTRLILRLFFADSATPDKRAKPAGVHGCDIRQQIGGTAPTDPAAMAQVAMETRSPYRADYDVPDIGKTVYFALRWLNTRGEPGPWSEFFTAVVPS
jgi:hypothetical protein